MLRLPEALKRRLTDAGMLALCTWALAAPTLQIFMLEKETGWALLFTCLFSMIFSLIAAFSRRWLRAGLRLILIASGLWAALSSPLPQAARTLIEASASLKPAQHIILLYADLLIPVFIALLMPYIRLLMQGEPSFSAPLLLVNVLMIWFAGARQSVSAYIPAMICIPLLYAYAAHTQLPVINHSGPRRGFVKAIPVALVIALIALILTPPFRSTVPALEQKADQLRQLINDHFFFTESRENFTLASEGYQPMGEKGLGGKPSISNTPVMEVETDRRVYLRGSILNLYNGRAWRDTLSNERYGYTTIRFAALRDAVLDADLPHRDLRTAPVPLDVTMLSPMPSTLFLPQRLRSLSTAEGMVPYLNAASEMFITRNLQPGDAYSLTYEPYIAGTAHTDDLAARLSGLRDERFEELKIDYTQLPSHLLPEGQVATLARAVVGEENDPYRMAMLIRDHLKTGFTYTLDVADAPEDLDFVAHFLQTKQGYCTYFASAMTILSRSVGLPARYVEGFVAMPAESGAPTLITGQHAHAWTEIYIPALGWVTFDATASTGELPPQPEGSGDDGSQGNPPPQNDPQQQEQEEQTQDENPEETEQEGDTPEPTPAPDPTPPPEDEQDSQNPADHPAPRLWWLWLLLVISLIAALVWRARALNPVRRAEQYRDGNKKLMIYWQALCLALAMQGKASLPQETLRGYAQRVAPGDTGLQALADAVSAVIYGRREASGEQVMTARLYYQGAYQSLSRIGRGRLMMSRLWSDIKSTAIRVISALVSPLRKRIDSLKDMIVQTARGLIKRLKSLLKK